MQRRLFFGLQIISPIQGALPKGRLIHENERHVTFAFLGNVDDQRLMENLDQLPLPLFKLGPAGEFSRCLFLPPRDKRVAAFEAKWWDFQAIEEYRNQLILWLNNLGYHPKEHPGPFLSHVTVARAPFNFHEWENFFTPLPFFASALHLYESIGSLNYRPLWSYHFIPPFQEIEHTADVAFTITGKTHEDLYKHGLLALCFLCPELLKFQMPLNNEDLIVGLNTLIATADSQIGVPLKAVSFHGEFIKKNDLLQWEMIVDV